MCQTCLSEVFHSLHSVTVAVSCRRAPRDGSMTCGTNFRFCPGTSREKPTKTRCKKTRPPFEAKNVNFSLFYDFYGSLISRSRPESYRLVDPCRQKFGSSFHISHGSLCGYHCVFAALVRGAVSPAVPCCQFQAPRFAVNLPYFDYLPAKGLETLI